jgi:hypothetical protein
MVALNRELIGSMIIGVEKVEVFSNIKVHSRRRSFWGL